MHTSATLTVLAVLLLAACGGAVSSHDGSDASAGSVPAAAGTSSVGAGGAAGGTTRSGSGGDNGDGAAGSTTGGSSAFGTGGTVASGGLPGTGGASVEVKCPTVDFAMTMEGFPSGAQLCSGPPSSCGNNLPPGTVHGSVQIEDATGTPLEAAEFCSFDCVSCSQNLCPAIPCVASAVIGSAIRDTWDGKRATTGICGAGRTCLNPATCAPPGRYIAHACAYVLLPADASGPACSGASTEPTCVDVPFDYPSSKVVEGTLLP